MKTAIVTGASSGIGLETARILVRKGYKVYDLSDHPSRVWCLQHLTVDVSNKAAVEKALGYIFTKEGAVDLLVCCAGVTLASPAELTRTDDARRVFDVNFWGCVYTTSYVLNRMKRQGRGRIILVSSLTGCLPLPYLSYYSASKAALLSWGCALHNEAKPMGIPVTVMAPGGVKTGFSAKRKKYTEYVGDPSVPGLGKAIEMITRIEQNGSSPGRIAKAILQATVQKCPPAVQAAGELAKPVMLAARLLPTKTLMYLLQKTFSV